MDYKNGRIYKVTDNAYTKQYIGSTCQSLSKRFSNHKSKYKLWQDGKITKITVFDIFDEFGIENCKIELIENYECNSKEELERKEGQHIKNNECVNKIIVGRDKQEYRQDNKEKIKEYKKQYYQDNKVLQKEQRKRNYQKKKEKIKVLLEKAKQIINCECGISYQISGKSNHLKSKKHISYFL